MIDETVVTLSRLQFALTALYHFLFVPLTLGLSWMLAIMLAKVGHGFGVPKNWLPQYQQSLRDLLDAQ